MPDYVLHTLWPWFPAAGITIGRHVFLKKELQGNQLLLAHELVHVGQMAKTGTLWFLLRYIFILPILWSPFRARAEAEACAVEARAGYAIDGDKGLAASIACAAYGWPCSRAKAAALIRSFMAA